MEVFEIVLEEKNQFIAELYEAALNIFFHLRSFLWVGGRQGSKVTVARSKFST